MWLSGNRNILIKAGNNHPRLSQTEQKGEYFDVIIVQAISNLSKIRSLVNHTHVLEKAL
jgi:hypothetical protein